MASLLSSSSSTSLSVPTTTDARRVRWRWRWLALALVLTTLVWWWSWWLQLSSASRLEKMGYLTKQGAIVKSWKRRWFVLRDTNLYYYRTKEVRASSESERGPHAVLANALATHSSNTTRTRTRTRTHA